MLFIANIGDSRAVLCRENGSKPTAVSQDHKPSRRDEKKRVESMGGRVGTSEDDAFATSRNQYIVRLCTCASQMLGSKRPMRVFPGGLSVSRTIGDISLQKPRNSSLPIRKCFRAYCNRRIRILILACDGVWDVMTNKQACTVTSKFIADPDEAAQQLAKEAYRKGSTDNISVVVVVFNHEQRTDSQRGSRKKQSAMTLIDCKRSNDSQSTLARSHNSIHSMACCSLPTETSSNC